MTRHWALRSATPRPPKLEVVVTQHMREFVHQLKLATSKECLVAMKLELIRVSKGNSEQFTYLQREFIRAKKRLKIPVHEWLYKVKKDLSSDGE